MMRDTESRRNKPRHHQSNNFLDKIYYYIVGALLVILILLIGYIYFSSQGAGNNALNNKIHITEKDFLSGSKKNEDEEAQEDSEETSDDSQDTAQSKKQKLNEKTKIAGGKLKVKVKKDAPIDTSYVPEFTTESADMDAVERGVYAVTHAEPGQLVAIWIGNDGPGRIKATYANTDYTEQYVVYFQYNDGTWYITDYEKGPYQQQ